MIVGITETPSLPIVYVTIVSSLSQVLVNSRLDYANSVLYNTRSVNKLKLQRVQNSLARVVSYTNSVEHIHPVLHQLHWLPINYRINYKVCDTGI